MSALLVLDDQLYTVEPFAEQARQRKISVEKTDSVVAFKERAETWAREGQTFAAAIDMNLPDLSEMDLDELGATTEEIGNGEAAGLVVARHVFMDGHEEPLRSALRSVPIAMISAENLAPDVRHEIEALHNERTAATTFIPKPDNSSLPIPKGITFDDFLSTLAGLDLVRRGGLGQEEAILTDVRRLLGLDDRETAQMLGFTVDAVDVRTLIDRGTRPASRDWRDRLVHLGEIAIVLLSIYRRSDAKKWLSTPIAALEGQCPREALISGSMEEMIRAKYMIMDLGNPN